MAQLYDRSLMLSIALQNAPFSLIVPFSHSEPPTKALNYSFRPNLTLQVAHLPQGSPDLITIPFADASCYPGLKRSLPIRSSISPNISLFTITSASWNTNLLAWRTKRPPVLMNLVWTLVSDQRFIASGKASRLMKLPRL